MKVKIKSIVSVTISLMMIFSLFGCTTGKTVSSTTGNYSSKTTSGNTSNEANDPRNQEHLKFSYFRPVWGAATYVGGKEFEKELFEKANVEIDVQIVPVAEYDAKVKLVVASRALPDVMWALGPVDASWREFESDGAFYPITDLLNSNSAVQASASNEIWEMMRNQDKEIYFVPNSQASEVPFLMYYRKDWFDALSIKEPTTISELETSLSTIKTKKSGVIPLTTGLGEARWMFKDLATSFGAVMNTWQPSENDANRLIPSFMTTEQQNYLFWLQDMRKRGLLDNEADLNPDFSHGKQKFMTGRAAAYPGGYPDYLEISTALAKNDPNAVVGIMSPLTGPTGIKGGTRVNMPMDRGFYLAGTLDSKKAARIFSFLEWTLTDGQDFVNYGIEGKMYTVDQNGKKVKMLEANRKDDYKYAQIEPLEFIKHPNQRLNFEDYKQQFESAGIGDKYDYWKGKFDEYCSNKFYNYLNATLTSPTNAKKGTQLNESYLNPTFGGIVLNASITRADYDKTVAAWRAAGGDDIIKEYNVLQKDKSKPTY